MAGKVFTMLHKVFAMAGKVFTMLHKVFAMHVPVKYVKMNDL